MTRVDAASYPGALPGLLAAIASFVLGCGPTSPYRPGILLERPLVRSGTPAGAAAARQVGCLDVRMALACNAAVAPDYPLVAFTLGNRCDAPVPVDFTRLRATGRIAGTEGFVTLSAFDPAREIRPAVLGSRAMAREVLEYDASPREATGNITEVCIDVGGLTSGGDQGLPLSSGRRRSRNPFRLASGASDLTPWPRRTCDPPPTASSLPSGRR